MNLIALPTMELVYDRRNYVNVFDFYEDGVSGIIQEVVHFFDRDESIKEKLISKIMDTYTSSYICLFHATVENYHTEHLVEITIRDLVDDVYSLINVLFVNQPVVFNARQCRWLGNDIIVEIERQPCLV